MNFGKLIASPLIALSIMSASNCPAQDPGKPGKPTKVTIALSDGSVLGPSNYGLWKARSAASNCKWTVKMNGRVAASGGPDDSIISTPHGLKGGVVHASNCGRFTK